MKKIPTIFKRDAGCPLHDSMTEEKRLNYTDMTEKEEKIKELFDMVYQWGRVGVETDFECNAFRKTLKEVVRLYQK